MKSSAVDEVAVNEGIILVLLPKSNKSEDSKKVIIVLYGWTAHWVVGSTE